MVSYKQERYLRRKDENIKKGISSLFIASLVLGSSQIVQASSVEPTIITDEQIQNSTILDESVNAYIEDVVEENNEQIEDIKVELDNEIVTDENGDIYQISVEDAENGDLMFTASTVEDLKEARSGTAKKCTTLYYIYHDGYNDYVGQVYSNVKYYKHYTNNAQPYYSFGKPSNGKYAYREDGFTVYNNVYKEFNTSIYKLKSSVKQTGKWSTNYSSKASYTRYFYAPQNK